MTDMILISLRFMIRYARRSSSTINKKHHAEFLCLYYRYTRDVKSTDVRRKKNSISAWNLRYRVRLVCAHTFVSFSICILFENHMVGRTRILTKKKTHFVVVVVVVIHVFIVAFDQFVTRHSTIVSASP